MSTQMDKSKFVVRSVGYAAANLPLDSKILEVHPAEYLGFVDGEITSDVEEFEQKGVDASGNEYIDTIKTSNSISATWLSLGSNRYSPPNVRRGERVLLMQYADADMYYWTTLGLDEHLRRRETVTWCFSNTTDEDTKELTSDNSYSLTVSTHNKEIVLQTSKSDGEPHEYIIRLDTKTGYLVIADDDRNQISLESADKRITLKNADESSVILEGKSIMMVAPEIIDMRAKQIVMAATTAVTMTAPTLGLSGDNSSYSVKSLTINAGSFGVNATSSFTGALTSNGKNISDSHKHDGVKSGGSSTGSVSG